VLDLLRTGEIEAAVGDIRPDNSEIVSFLTDPDAAAAESFRRTGVFPINHLVVIKRSIAEEAPWIGAELLALFEEAKRSYFRRLDEGHGLTPADGLMMNLRALLGPDPYPFGLEPNESAVAALVRYAVDQRVIPTPMTPSALFADS
jgi:4,5-dihydroxyphthalate decarboxylase